MARIKLELMPEEGGKTDYLLVTDKNKKTHCYRVTVQGKYSFKGAVRRAKEMAEILLLNDPAFKDGKLSGRIRLPTKLEIDIQD